MLTLYYFNWVGTPEELKEYVGRIKSISDGIDGLNFKGVFAPSSEWNFVLLFESATFEKALECYRTYMKKFGPSGKIPLEKTEILFTFEELGYPP